MEETAPSLNKPPSLLRIVWLAAYQNIWLRRVLYILIGATAGYAYYYFIGCASGACPISSNPYISTGYGAFVGLVMTTGSRGKRGR